MSLPADNFAHLALLIARLQDAEILLDTEADTLMGEVQAARQAQEQGQTSALRQHLEMVAGLVTALVDARLLPNKDGQAVIATARNLVAAED